ncbi:FAS1 domain-containing protein [Stagonosporopsis vannaccii]|nr:FAS1 domain-containing protein [Stagonosporopsis vannaccii]
MRLFVYPIASLCLFFACAAEPRPFETIVKSFNKQSPLRDYIMPPTNDASSGIIISDVIGRAQNIAIFSGLTRDIDAVSGRLEDAAQNATVLAPDNTVMKSLKRKPWEDPEDYNQFGEQTYAGTSGSDRAHSNLERFVKSHIVPESPWEEGKKVKTLAGNEVWWESKDGHKTVSGGGALHSRQQMFSYFRHYIVSLARKFHQSVLNRVR